MHDPSVPRNRIHHFHFVGPPVGEAAGAGPMLGNGVRHFVALQNVLQRANTEAFLFAQPQQRQNFILAIGVAVHDAIAFENLHQRLQLKVEAGRNFQRTLIFIHRIPTFMHGPVELCLVKAISHKRRDPHSGVGVSAARTLHIFTQGKFDPGLGVLHAEVLGITAPLQFHHRIAAADRIGRAVQLVCGGQSPGQLAVPVHVVRVDHVFDRDLCRAGPAAFIDSPVDARVRMAINQAWGDVQPRRIHHTS